MTGATPTLRTYQQLSGSQQQQARELVDHNNAVLRGFLGRGAPQYSPRDVAYYVTPRGKLDGRVLPLRSPD